MVVGLVATTLATLAVASRISTDDHVRAEAMAAATALALNERLRLEEERTDQEALSTAELIDAIVTDEDRTATHVALINTQSGEPSVVWTSLNPDPDFLEADGWPGQATLVTPDGTLTVAATPATFAFSSPMVWWVPIAGIALTLLTAALVRSYQRLDLAEGHMDELATARDRFEKLAQDDPLTGLMNRRGFSHWVLDQPADSKLCVIYVDVVGYSELHTVFGSAGARQIIQQLGRRLRTLARDTSWAISRVGGDKFLIGAHCQHGPERMLDRVATTLTRPTDVVGTTVTPKIALGYAEAQKGDGDPLILIDQAEIACKAGKSDGANKQDSVAMQRGYTPDLAITTAHREALATGLRNATRDPASHFTITYGRTVGLATGETVGWRTDVRWEHHLHNGDPVPNQTLAALAHDLGLNTLIAQWADQQACQESAAADLPRVTLTLPPQQIFASDFVDRVAGLLETHNLHGNQLEFAFSEETAMRPGVPQRLADLVPFGVKFSVTNLGLGRVSLLALADLPNLTLRIDPGFVADLPNSRGRVATVSALATQLSLAVIAANVTTDEQRQTLLDLGIWAAEGPLFGINQTIGEVQQSG